MYTYRATVLKVVDGDTVHLMVDQGFDTFQKKTVRLFGIDAPEHGTPEGDRATKFVREQLPEGLEVTISTVKDRKEKYGRYLAEIWLPETGVSLNQQLVVTGNAVQYYGGTKGEPVEQAPAQVPATPSKEDLS